jgi:RND superfamily putative drug exporter
LEGTRNFAARAGRWSARHSAKGDRRVARFCRPRGGRRRLGWHQVAEDEDSGVGESREADRVLADAFPENAEETVLIQSEDVGAEDPAFRAVVVDVANRLESTPNVVDVEIPYRGLQ